MEGIDPERQFSPKSRCLTGGEMPITGGIEPTSWFCCKDITVSDELFMMDSGMRPVRALLPRST